MREYKEAFYVGCYWGPRQESVQEVTARAVSFLKNLRGISSLFRGWHPLPRKAARFRPDGKHLEGLFLAGRNRTDIGKEVIPELGFSMSLVSEFAERQFDLSISAGMYSKWISNVCVMHLPPFEEKDSDLATVPGLMRLLEVMVASWEPDDGRVSSHLIHNAVDQDDNDINFGWLTYVSAARGSLPPAPPPSRVVPLGIAGHLIIATDDVYSSANPAHVAAVRAIVKTFRK